MEPVETIRKVYAHDLREKQAIHTVFKVTRKVRQQGRSGKPYLVLTLGDRTGEVDARIFDKVDEWDAAFLEGDYVLVKGNVILWQKKPQVVIESLERLDPEPIDPAEFAVPPPPPPPPPEAEHPTPPARAEGEKPHGEPGARSVLQIRELVERVGDPHLKQLLHAFLEDPEIHPGLALAPAAKGIHHAYKGGLADHLLSVMKLAHRIADHYPMVDRDLLLAGALLHDICKVGEIVPNRGGFEYTDEGRLVGHLVMTAQKIREKAARIPGFPRALEHHLTHIVLAHHGQLEWGSPKVPMTLEALLVHLIDTIDSRVASWLELMERDDQEGPWTEVTRLYDRHLWKGVVPTARNRSPLEGRPQRRHKKKARDREREREREREKPAPKPEVPAFKPLRAFSEVTSAPESAAPQAERPSEPAQPPPAPNEQAHSGD